MIYRTIELNELVPEGYAGQRLDQVLARLFPEHSRERLKQWILTGACQINGFACKPKQKVTGGEQVEICAQISEVSAWSASPMPLDIVHEDEAILVINKPANLVVHPAAGHRADTLVNGLLHYLPSLNQLPRAGVVHRLDKDTTGLMVVAKTLEAHTSLVAQLQDRTMGRVYEAVVHGCILAGGCISAPIGRHPKDRLKMAVTDQGKPATTHYRVLARFQHHTHLLLRLETGRTHQIRVHMSHLLHPIVGDKTYGLRRFVNRDQNFPRQALHAQRLSLQHPVTHECMEWEAPLPNDMLQLLNQLPTLD